MRYLAYAKNIYAEDMVLWMDTEIKELYFLAGGNPDIVQYIAHQDVQIFIQNGWEIEETFTLLPWNSCPSCDHPMMIVNDYICSNCRNSYEDYEMND